MTHRPWRFVAPALLALALAACSPAGDDDGADASPTPTATTSESPTPSAKTVSERGPMVTCTLVFGPRDGGPSLAEYIPTALIGIGSNLEGDQLDNLLSVNEALGEALDVAPEEMIATLELLRQPFQEVQEVLDSGGGNLSMDTSHVAADITTLMGLCADAGYQIEASADAEPGGIPSPDAAQAIEMVNDLTTINLDFIKDQNQVVSQTRNQCDSILKAERGEIDPATLVATAQQRFDPIALTDEQAQQVNDIIAATDWCTAS